MIHAREDYNRIQDPALTASCAELQAMGVGPAANPIAADEPVMLFRAKDKHFRAVLKHYRGLIRNDPFGQPQMVDLIDDHLELAARWQMENGTKTPDVPSAATAAGREEQADA